ncbi:internal virion protein [Synechococcus T7-like virus S-TIP28]|uniref:Internal virion protein n=1 Tax=Synechococcus T7-like virus S-TIP28 TaxID=1332140 RepID=A0AAE9BP55_9CAUD|nr:internal virion protein [Synechococcus T7-like virus S-TIP28]
MDSINEAYAQQAAAEEQAAQERIDAETAMSASSTPEVEEQAQPEQQQQPDQVTQLMQGAEDFVAGLLGQDQEQRQEARKEGQAKLQELQEEFDKDESVIAETTRAVAGGLAGAVEGVGETAELIKDTVTGEAFKDGYEAADWDLGITENRTQVGKFARTMVSMLTVMRGAGAAGVSVGGGGSVASRLGSEAARGAIADLIVSQDDENLTNMLEDMGLPHISALAVDDEDGPWSARLKNIVEGGVFGVAVDGVGEVLGAIAKGRAAVKAGKSADEAVDETIKQLELNLESRPGKDVREATQTELGSSPSKPALYEPSDAASRTTEHTAAQAAVSQFKQGSLPQTSAKPMLTDAAFKKIVEPRAAQGMTADAIGELEDVIVRTASSMNAEELAKELGQSTDETVSQALRAVADFLGADTTEAGLKAFADKGITFTTKRGVVAEREGVVAVKTLIGDTANQINETAANIMDAANTGADATRQVEMLGDRLKALLRLHKTSSVHYGGGLAGFKIGGLSGMFDSSGALAKEIADNDKFIDNMVDLARKGDPKAINDFKNTANALVLAGGDPGKQLSFWQQARKLGTQEAMKSMYNSMLSSPLTHVRNFVGNAVAATTRPLTMAIGRGVTGDMQGARAALGSFHAISDSLTEAWTMAGAAWKNGAPSGGKYVDQSAEMAKELDQLRATAQTPGERGAVFFMTKLHDLNNNPWATYPSRALTAGDEMFKTLVARMEMKRQVFDESLIKTGTAKFDPDTYAQKLQEKLGRNGEIVDEQLREVTTEATFQQELKGVMKAVDNLTKSHPVFTYLMPFVRTPHNLMVYAGTHTPGLNRFLDEYKAVMAGTDENAKAVMRGREALGWMTITTGIGMAASGTMTGNGPVDPEKRAAWLKTHQPQSIKVNGKWVSYGSIEPLNTIFAAVVDLTELAKAGDAASYDRSAGQLAYTVAQATFNKSYFQGLTAAVETLNPNNLAKEGWVEKDALKALNSFIPLSGARRQLSKALEPAMLDWRNEYDRAFNTALPGYAAINGLEKIDIFTGETMYTENTNLLNWFLPFSIKDVETDPVLVNIADKGIDINATIESANGVELNATDRAAIDRLTAETGLHDELKRHFAEPWFKEDYKNWEKADNKGEIRDALWYSETIRIIQDARRRAVDYYAANNEEFAARKAAADMQKYRAGMGNYDLPDEIQAILDAN